METMRPKPPSPIAGHPGANPAYEAWAHRHRLTRAALARHFRRSLAVSHRAVLDPDFVSPIGAGISRVYVLMRPTPANGRAGSVRRRRGGPPRRGRPPGWGSRS